MTEQTCFEEDLKDYRESTKTIKYPFIICFITAILSGLFLKSIDHSSLPPASLTLTGCSQTKCYFVNEKKEEYSVYIGDKYFKEEMLSSPFGTNFEIIDYKEIDNIEKIPRTILGISVVSTLAFLCAYIVLVCNLFYARFLAPYLKD